MLEIETDLELNDMAKKGGYQAVTTSPADTVLSKTHSSVDAAEVVKEDNHNQIASLFEVIIYSPNSLFVSIIVVIILRRLSQWRTALMWPLCSLAR